MNIRKKTVVVWGALLAMVLGTTTAFARMHILTGPPPLVRFTGTLVPDADQLGGSNSLFFSVRGKEWLFQVSDVKMVPGTEQRDAFILRDIFPGRLRVSGPSAVMDAFQNPDIEGQTISLEGHLYVDDRRFLLTTAEVHPDDMPEQSQP